MSDAALAEALLHAKSLEQQARDWHQASRDEAERDGAVVVLRNAAATRRALEAWIGTRLIRAQMGL